MRHYGIVICGGGPSGVSPIVAAAVQGRLDELLDQGVLLVEANATSGAGALAGYRIRANSLGVAFLECLDGPAGATVLRGLADTAEARRLREWADDYPPLPVVGDFLRLVGDRVAATLRGHPRCEALLGHRVVQVATGPHRAVVRVAAVGGEQVVSADRVVLATGGREREFDSVLPGLVGDRPLPPVLPSSVVITDPAWQPDAVDPARPTPGGIAVLGGGHSGWAVAAHLARLRAAGRVTGPVRVVQRRDPPVFYFSEAEARAERYVYDQSADVCPASGRVHRFGGLRGPARTLARQVLGLSGDPAPEGFDQVNLGARWTADGLADAGVPDADLIVTAFGYDASLPTLTDLDGEPLALARSRGAVDTGQDGRPRLVTGRLADRLVMYGLGAGLTPSASTGGEPGYAGRLDGVWVYQHDIGAVVLDSLLGARGADVSATATGGSR